jgi:hypothetical protein
MKKEHSADAILILLLLKLGTEWRLDDEQLAAIADVRTATIGRWRRSPAGRPSSETQTRIELVLDIQLRVRALFKDPRSWLTQPSEVLKNKTPLILMTNDGTAGLLLIQRQLRAMSSSGKW